MDATPRGRSSGVSRRDPNALSKWDWRGRHWTAANRRRTTQDGAGPTRLMAAHATRRRTTSTLFETLAHPRRRAALAQLSAHHEATLADLAELVAETESDTPVEQLSAERVRHVYFELYHRHVPKLESARLVRYDQEADLVAVADGMVDAIRLVRNELAHLVTNDEAVW